MGRQSQVQQTDGTRRDDLMEILEFSREDWVNLSNIRGANKYYTSTNVGQWDEMIRVNKELFSDIVAERRRVS